MRRALLPFALLAAMSCGRAHCTEDRPATTWDPPRCSDYEMDTALIDNAGHGDRSAIELLRRRHDEAFTASERNRIATALLKHVPDDEPYWKEVAGPAENAVAFTGELRNALSAFCADHGCKPETYVEMATETLELASRDERSRPLLHRALESEDAQIVRIAIDGLAAQHDESSLEAIDRAIRRFPDNAPMFAMSLAVFHSDAADRVALQYFTEEEEKAAYREARKQ